MGRAFEYRRASKEKRWDKMSKVFPKLAKAITVAAKEGGIEADMNPKLRTAIQNAKAENMPKDNIEAAIKRSLGKDADTIVEVVYEGKGPHGVLIFIETATDNTTRTLANVKSYLNKSGGLLAPTGSLEFMFSRKAVFEIEKTDTVKIEDIELELIDAGLEEVEQDDEIIIAYGDYTSFGTMSKAFEDLKIPVRKSTLQRFPNSPVSYSDEQLVDIDKLLDKIEDDEDVLAVYTNIA